LAEGRSKEVKHPDLPGEAESLSSRIDSTEKKPIAKSDNCVILFTKSPAPDQVKTRLVENGFLNAEEAVEIYEAFLSDILETVGRYAARNRADLVVSYFPEDGLDKILEILKSLRDPVKVARFDLQEGSSFDQRMNSAFSKVFAAGYQAAVIIGGDSPTISEKHIEEAFALLRDPRHSNLGIIVVGPCSDGGVYLIGLKRDVPFNFSGVFQKKDELDISLSMLESRSRELSIQLLRISTLYDVDIPKDMEVLREELSRNPELAPHTREVLRRLKGF